MKVTQTQQNTMFTGHTVITFKKAQEGMCKAAKRIAQEKGAIAQGNAETALLLLDGKSVLVLDKSITDKETIAFTSIFTRFKQTLNDLGQKIKACYSRPVLDTEKKVVDKFRQETTPNFIMNLLQKGLLTRIEA